MNRKNIFVLILLFVILYIMPVNACPFSFSDYQKTGEEHSFIVGDYVFDLSMGFSPSLEDFSIAARTILEDQDEYVYEIMYIPSLGEYDQLELFSGAHSKNKKDWPSFFDTTYNYRTNINAKKPDYDIFTCKTDNIKISYSLLNTKGEEEYKTEANRIVDIQSAEELGQAFYCITTDNSCDPNKKIDVKGTFITSQVDYETNELPQHICSEALDKYGNTSGIVCDNVMVKVDGNPIKIDSTEEYNDIIEGSPQVVDNLFDVEYSVSKGNVYYFYYNGGRKYVLSNMRDLPSGDIKVEAIGRSGSGLITEKDRTIKVRKSIVTYDYKTNGGSSASKEKSEVSYDARVDLTVSATKDGYEFVGWNTDPNANFALEALEITDDVTLYAIFKKDIQARFEIYNKQGNIPAVSEYDETTCTIYNQETECEVRAPIINSRVRYEAMGWSREKDNTAEIHGGDLITVENNEVLYSVTRSIVPYTATFIVIKDGNITKDIRSCNLYNGETSCQIDTTNITSDDYEGRPLTGFSTSSEKVIEDNKFIIDSGVTYYALYEDMYTINFVSSEEHTETFKAGVAFIVTESEIKQVTTQVVAPDINPKNNYTALGWRNDLKLEEPKLGAGEKVDATGNTTYYAIYSKSIMINYESENTENVPGSVNKLIYYNSGAKTTSSANVTLDAGIKMKKTGYIFNGWSSDGTDYEQGKTYSFNESKTFTARWSDNATLIIFDYETNGGTSASLESSTFIHGVSSAINLANITAYKRGYDFIGWSLYPTATTTTMTSYTPNVGEDKVTLYAIFKKDFSINYVNINQSVLSISSPSQSKYTIYNNSEGVEITLPSVTSNDSNIEFIGWSTSDDSINKEYDPGNKVLVNERTSFYTIIKNKTPLISTYVYYDGNTRKTAKSECYLYNKNPSCPTTFDLGVFNHDGSVLTDWSSSSTSIILAPKQTISTNKTFYGVYTKNVNITYLSGMNTDSETPSRVTEIVGVNYLVNESSILPVDKQIALENPDGISGYTTLGWRLDGSREEATYKDKDKIYIKDDKIFYGVYSKTIALRYATLGGTPEIPSQTKNVIYNTYIKNPINNVEFTVAEAPSKVGVALDSWLLNNDENQKYHPNDKIILENNSALYAKWTPRLYTVTLDATANGGINSDNNIVEKYFEESFELDKYNAIPADGYEFVGWSLSPNSKELLTEYIIPAENTTLYAVFKKELRANWLMYDTNAGHSDSPYTSCYIYNNETSCNAQVGTISANTSYQAVGWSKTPGSINIDAGIGLLVEINENTDFYSITKKSDDLVGTFYYFNNGKVVNVRTSCALYNGATSCDISTPATPANHINTVFKAWSSSQNSYVATGQNIRANTNYYAYYNLITELKYNDGLYVGETNSDDTSKVSASTETITSTVEYVANPSGGWSSIPTIDLKTPSSIDGYISIGWREDTQKTEQSYDNNQTVSMDRSYYLYGTYDRTITLSYDGQGGTPIPPNQTATQYYNSGSGYTTHNFSLASPISKIGHVFKGWRAESPSGTQYNAESQINIPKDTTMYAYFEFDKYEVTLNGDHVSYQDIGGNAINSILVPYTTTSQFKAVPQSGYYFESITCTNNYTVTGFNSGTAHYTTQTLTIKNPTITTGGACTIKMHARSYPATATYHPQSRPVSCNCHTVSVPESYCCETASNGCTNCCIRWCNRYHDETRCDTCYEDTSYYTYSCPNGGTLSGTTCVF